MGVLDTIAKVGHALINPAAAVAGVVGDFVSQHSANKNVDKQIAAQREENEKARSHNLMLAELQNKWNVEQWAKENEYNSPSAQMARYAAAGLNPNLIYGQSNTSAQLSGSLSSGAPASPADMSAYGRKGSPVGKALENLDPFMYEQLRGMKLKNDEQELINWDKEQDKGIRNALRTIASDPQSLEKILESKEFGLGSSYEVRRKLLELQEMNYQHRQSAWNNMMRNETFEDELQALSAKYQVDYGKAQEFMTNLELLTNANASLYRRQSAVREITDFFKDDLTLKEFVQGLFKLAFDYLPLSKK